MRRDKQEVELFWDEHPLGGKWSSHRLKMRWRYEREPWIADIIKQTNLKNKNVLEVGCGPGLDTALLCMAGARVTALDLSKESLKWARQGLREGGLKARLVHGDAEKLPFKNESFDFVYSYGVLHHTPNTKKAIDEVYRVLKPSGEAIIMLYRKHTPQQAIISSLRAISKLADALSGKKDVMFRGAHRLFRINPDSSNPQHGTSLFELFRCPVLQTFSKKEVKTLFRRFKTVRLECYQTGLNRILEFVKLGKKSKSLFSSLDKKLQKWLGFYMIVHASK